VSAYQRRKGHNWERELARRLRAVFPDARRGLQYQDGGASAPDVVVPAFHIEAKVGARPNLTAALEQAERDAKPGLWPVAVCKQDNHEPTVTMRLDDWIEITSQWWQAVNR
jgi:hypothetical protein